jgi:hypothetical protein
MLPPMPDYCVHDGIRHAESWDLARPEALD